MKFIKNEILRKAVEWILDIALAIIIFLLIHTFVFRTGAISGVSMEPSLLHGDKVIISKISYLFSKPKIGDVIAFPEKENKYLVKRIIAKEFDEVDIENYRFKINGEFLEDEFSEDLLSSVGNQSFPIIVPESSYFVLGDNRGSSMDSRFTSIGTIHKNKITGKVTLRFYPFSKFKFIK